MADLSAYQTRINRRLDAVLSGSIPDRLLSAMRYSVLGGGKRVRPCLVYLGAEAAGAELDLADTTACAGEHSARDCESNASAKKWANA